MVCSVDALSHTESQVDVYIISARLFLLFFDCLDVQLIRMSCVTQLFLSLVFFTSMIEPVYVGLYSSRHWYRRTETVTFLYGWCSGQLRG